jgi:hypothetical protein
MHVSGREVLLNPLRRDSLWQISLIPVESIVWTLCDADREGRASPLWFIEKKMAPYSLYSPKWHPIPYIVQPIVQPIPYIVHPIPYIIQPILFCKKYHLYLTR